METYNWSSELFGKSLVKYIQRTKHTVQPTSYDSYMKYGIKIAEYFDMYCIHTNELTPEMIEDYYNYIREKSPVTENTVRHYHVLIYKFCRWLYKRGYRIDNPADKIDKTNAVKGELSKAQKTLHKNTYSAVDNIKTHCLKIEFHYENRKNNYFNTNKEFYDIVKASKKLDESTLNLIEEFEKGMS